MRGKWFCKYCGNNLASRQRSTRYCDALCQLYFHIKVGDIDECWPWTGAYSGTGYGNVVITGRKGGSPHSLLFCILNNINMEYGKIHICHTCNNKACCNPNHLYKGTPRDNADDTKRVTSWDDLAKRGHIKLTIEKARAIRKDPRLLREIAADYGVGLMAISQIKRNKTWVE